MVHQKQTACLRSRNTEETWCTALRETWNKGWGGTEVLWSCSVKNNAANRNWAKEITQMVAERWTLFQWHKNTYYFSYSGICKSSKTCTCFSCMTKAIQTPHKYEITSTVIFHFPLKKKKLYKCSFNGKGGQRFYLRILGWLTIAAPISFPIRPPTGYDSSSHLYWMLPWEIQKTTLWWSCL